MKTWNRVVLGVLVLLSTFIAQPSAVLAQGTAFTYQGRLNSGASAANGNYDLTFSLFNVSSGGSAVAGPLATNAVAVSNGLFTIALDFGPGVFNGPGYWLEIGVRTNGGGAFTTLAPRQQLTPSPYAIYSENVAASGISGTIPAANLGGTYGNAVNFNNGADSFDGSFYGQFFGSSFTGGIFTGAFVGNGSGLTGVNAAALNGLNATNFWQTTGNAGTAAGGNFVGTTDNQPLELHVNSQRALRLEPASPDGPNIIGGYSNNFVGAGISSATIAGGGLSGLTNRITGLGYGGAIGGGRNNWVNNFNGAVSGGANNTAFENATSIGGGSENYAGGDHDTIGGGQNNTNYGDHATISGGANNLIIGAADHASISGGGGNTIIGSAALPVYDTIGGGANNLIQTNTSYATISGGQYNAIQSFTSDSFIGGGQANNAFGSDATIGGGTGNSANYLSTVGGGAKNAANGFGAVVAGGGIWVSNSFLYNVGNTAYGNSSAVGGGAFNYAAGGYSAVGGGFQNTAGVPQYGSGNSPVVAGGYQNTASADFSAVSGGSNNVASGVASVVGGGGGNIAGSPFATVSGGSGNNASSGNGPVVGGGFDNSANGNYSTLGGGLHNAINNDYATLGGGVQNTNDGAYATLGGGVLNTVTGTYATVPGGYANVASGQYSIAAGNSAVASQSGAFVWADGLNYVFDPYSQAGPQGVNNSFNVRSTSGFYIVTGVNGSGLITSEAYLGANSTSWSTLSDRNAKKDFAPVDCQAVLDKLATVPIEHWHYKWEKDGDVLNIGPMAQDFKNAFYPGRDDKSITTLEFDGVELAAIEGLNQKVEQQRLELNQKETEVTELKQQNEALEKRLDNLEQMIKSNSEIK
jgi:hypothetical protein